MLNLLKVHIIGFVIAFFGFSSIGSAIAHDGEKAKETRNLSSFEKIVIDGSVDVNVVVGASQSVEVRTESDHFDLVKTEVQNETLFVTKEKHRWRNTGVNLEITIPNLTLVKVDGSGDLNIIDVDSDVFEVAIDGSGNIILSGTCGELMLDLEGSGDIEAERLKCRVAEIELEGSGDIDAFASMSVNIDLSGSGDITVYGNPEKVKSKTKGSGNFEVVQ